MSRNHQSNGVAYITGLSLAFGLGVLVTAVDYRDDYQERYPSYIDDDHGKLNESLPFRQSRARAPARKTPCENPKGHNEADLCAQWRAANGAKQAARWGLWNMLLSILGLIGLGLTLWFNHRAIQLALKGGEDTERALKIAAKTAGAAAKQARVAEDTATRQLRAYLSLGMPVILELKDGSHTAHFQIQNTGQTPATDVEVEDACYWMDYPLRREAIKEVTVDKRRFPDIGPRGERGKRYALNFNEEERGSIERGSLCAYIQIALSYTTYAGERIQLPVTEWIIRREEILDGSPSLVDDQHYAQDEV